MLRTRLVLVLLAFVAAGCAEPTSSGPAGEEGAGTSATPSGTAAPPGGQGDAPAPPPGTRPATAPATGAGTGSGAPGATDEMRRAHEAAWLCRTPVEVDDLNTTAVGGLTCSVSLSFNATHVTVTTTGVPHHDLQSGPSPDKTAAQQRAWRLPLAPRMAAAPTKAPERGAIAVAANGAAIYGPEEGSGGAAVANHYGYYKEDREMVWLGLCDGHSGPHGEFHYHADANCVHWHPGPGEAWTAYSWDKVDKTTHSPIVGWAFDGFPIYGSFAWDDAGDVTEMTSSFRLKAGADGYNGIDDFEYVEGLGTLDACNGRFAKTPEFPNGTYAYYSTRHNGAGSLGFPHFLLCYKGVVETSNVQAGGGTGGMTGGQMPPPPTGATPPPPTGGARPPPPSGCTPSTCPPPPR